MTYEELYTKCKNAYNLDELNIGDFRPASTIFDTEDTPNSIIIWFKDGAKTQYTLDEEQNTWTVKCLKPAMESPYLDIINMTNKEAAEIIRSLLINVVVGRGNGKILMSLKHNTAFNKAIKCLEEHPDTATDMVEKEFRNIMTNQQQDHRVSIVDEYGDFKPSDSCVQALTQYERYMELNQQIATPKVVGVDLAMVDMMDDTSMHKSMNESHSDYCKRMAQIFGLLCI